MLDYSVMWITQRTGKNTAISFRLGTAVLGALIALALVVEGFKGALGPMFFVVVGCVVGAVWLAWGLVNHFESPEDKEHTRLAALERTESRRAERANVEATRQADLQRLRNKYRS